jgi:hypothetical protein
MKVFWYGAKFVSIPLSRGVEGLTLEITELEEKAAADADASKRQECAAEFEQIGASIHAAKAPFLDAMQATLVACEQAEKFMGPGLGAVAALKQLLIDWPPTFDILASEASRAAREVLDKKREVPVPPPPIVVEEYPAPEPIGPVTAVIAIKPLKWRDGNGHEPTNYRTGEAYSVVMPTGTGSY